MYTMAPRESEKQTKTTVCFMIHCPNLIDSFFLNLTLIIFGGQWQSLQVAISATEA